MIRNIAAGEIRIGEEIYREPVAITDAEVIGVWDAIPVEQLTLEHLQPLIDTRPELIVVGTGTENIFAPKEIMFGLARKGIGLEIMDSAAAARTFNVLASEGRKVAAVLYV